MRTISIYYDVTNQLIYLSDGVEPAKDDLPYLYFRERAILNVQLVTGDDLAAYTALTGAETFSAAIDNDYSHLNDPMVKSLDSDFNLPGDWQNGSDADVTQGQLSIRVNCDTTEYLARAGTLREILKTLLEIQIRDSESNMIGNYTMPVRCYNILDDSGIVPPNNTSDYFTKTESDARYIRVEDSDYFDKALDTADDIDDGEINVMFTATERTKLAGIEAGAKVNNISDANALDLTDGEDSSLHYHDSDRARSNHKGTQSTSTVIMTGTSNASLESLNANHLSTTSYGGFDISKNPDGTVNMTLGTVLLRSSNAEDSVIGLYNLGPVSNFPLTDNATNFIYCELVSEVAQFNVTTDINTILTRTDIACIYTITRRLGTELNIIDLRGQGQNESWHHRISSLLIDKVQKASGGVLTLTTHKPKISNATFYYLSRPHEVYGIDCTLADTFTRVYRNGSGGFTYVGGQNTIDYSHYDDGDGTLGVVPNNSWGNHWVYAIVDDIGGITPFKIVYGVQVFATQNDAENAEPPTTLPVELAANSASVLMFQIAYKGDGTGYSIIDLHSTKSKAVSTTGLHNELGGIQGGSSNDYYHLTAAQLSGDWGNNERINKASSFKFETYSANAEMDIGGAGSTFSYVDMHGNPTGAGNDYDCRLSVQGGANGANGLGRVNLEAGSFLLNGYSVSPIRSGYFLDAQTQITVPVGGTKYINSFTGQTCLLKNVNYNSSTGEFMLLSLEPGGVTVDFHFYCISKTTGMQCAIYKNGNPIVALRDVQADKLNHVFWTIDCVYGDVLAFGFYLSGGGLVTIKNCSISIINS